MPAQNAKVRIGRLAAHQFGCVSRAQLTRLELSSATVGDWITQGYLHRLLPRVYAVGHIPTAHQAKLAAGLLYAGPGAMLSHATAAWWLGLADTQPYRIDVSTPRRCQSIPGIRIHPRRNLERDWHRGLPVTTLAQTLLDYAAVASLSKLRRALAQADYDGTLDVPAIEAEMRQGCPGGTKLRHALERHQPKLGWAKSRTERSLVELCEAGGLPLPQLNVRVAGWEVDALWLDQRLVVELDGWRNHRTRAQVNRDRRKELELRAAGFIVVRYSEEQIVHDRQRVLAELLGLLGLRNPVPSA
jgi:hypothetical protein